MLETTNARDRVKRAEAVTGHLTRVVKVDVETVPPAGGHLCRRQRDADPCGALFADEVQQRPPPTGEIEHPAARPNPNLLGDVLMLAPLGGLEAQREITVVLRAAEVRELTQTQPKDPIDQRIRELEIRPVGHRDRS